MKVDNTKLSLAVLAVAFAAGTVAFAQDAQAPAGPGEGRMAGPMSFETLDTNGDGQITVDDLKAKAEARFAEFDTNGDGQVTREEFAAHAAAQASERAGTMFDRLDADGDGTLSRDVLEARGGRGGPEGGMERMIARFDTDNSGGVSAEEFEAAKVKMAEMRGMRGERGEHGKRGGHDGEGRRWMPQGNR